MSFGAYINAYRMRLVAIDAVLSAITFYAAFSLRTDQYPLGPAWTKAFVYLIGVLIILRIGAMASFGVYRFAVRHTSARDALSIAGAIVLGTTAFMGFVMIVRRPMIPLSVCVIEATLAFLALAGSRLAYRLMLENGPVRSSRSTKRRILVIGAGRRGAAIAREIRERARDGLVLVGFLDDDPGKQNQLIQSAPVLGTSYDALQVVDEHHVDELIIAISTARGHQIREITKRCEAVPARLRISPGFSELDEHDLFSNLRDLQVEDLLQREPVRVNVDEISGYLAGEAVLITGAGGSIGGELARQIGAVGPAKLILLGHGENSIFEIAEDLRERIACPIVTVIADVRDAERLAQVFGAYHPTVVFHAAAHKHVPLMEQNPQEAITNNVLGTRNLARVSKAHGVKRFVMISTDKAVNPTSIMGASKRVAERVIQREAEGSTTQFATVRFGNVLGSRGSVVPVMRGQIARGGPVTVTHPDVTRYFMTIPEAVQLVIQAGALGGQGIVYVLDMGEPVRIMELAHNIIRLSGLVPEKDIKIAITGLRPGEKLTEELLTSVEATNMTKHERIFHADLSPPPVDDVDESVDAMIAAAFEGDLVRMLSALRILVPRFTSDPQLEALARQDPGAPADTTREDASVSASLPWRAA